MLTSKDSKKKHLDSHSLCGEGLTDMRARMLSAIGHEIRTPLAAIKGFVDTLLKPDARWSEEEKMDFLLSIAQEAERLDRIMAIAECHVIEPGSSTDVRKRYSVDEIYESVRPVVERIARHNHLVVSIPADIPEVEANLMQIGRVIVALVENAVASSREGWPVSVTAACSDRESVFHITDRGTGFQKSEQPLLFDPSYQIRKYLSGGQSRANMALPDCRRIIEAHGGTISVTSKVGEGADFCFTLPIADRPEQNGA